MCFLFPLAFIPLLSSDNIIIWVKRSIFQIFWKKHCCAIFLFLKLATSDLRHRPNFDQGFWFWTQILTAQYAMGQQNWFVVAVLLLYMPKILVIMLLLTTSTVVIQLQKLSYYASFCTLQVHSEFKIEIFGPNQVYCEDLRLLTLKTKIWHNNVLSRSFGKYSFQALEGLKGLSSKPSGDCIVVPNFCFLS